MILFYWARAADRSVFAFFEKTKKRRTEMKYDFTTVVNRENTGSSKWDGVNATVDCVPLSVADMEFPTAEPIKAALKNLVDTSILGYTHENDEYYDAVISWQKRRHDFDIKKEWILTTPGVVDALGLLIEAVTKPAQSVLILSPVYYPFDMAVIAKTRHIVYSELINNNGHYELDYKDIEEKCKRKDVTAMMFCNPHNPVGRVWTREELERVGNICCDNGVFIIDDEIHNDLIMPGYKHTVMATVNDRIKDNIAVCTAPSKTFNIAGAQCSNIIIPNAKARSKANACSLLNMHLSLNVFAYTACKAAYNECEDWLEELLKVIDGNAKYITEFMAENIPEIKVIPLEGTYLLWLDVRDLDIPFPEFKAMLLEQKVYLDNGELFGRPGRGFQRINLACPRATLEKAMERFLDGVRKIQNKWKEEGKPVHRTISVGDDLSDFVYSSPNGTDLKLKDTAKKNTLIVFSRYFDCQICQIMLKLYKAAYPAFKAAGCDIKFVMQTDAATLSKHQSKYPFELVADPDAKLYDRYNIFEAHDIIEMVAGDKLFEKLVGKDIKKLLNLSIIDSFAAAADTSVKETTVRENQLPAFFMVNSQMKVTYAHYSKTISDFPKINELIKGIKK